MSTAIKVISPYNAAAENYKTIVTREDEVLDFIKGASKVAHGNVVDEQGRNEKNPWHILLDEAKKLRQDVKNLQTEAEFEKSKRATLARRFDDVCYIYRECQQAMADVTGNPNAGRDYNEDMRAYYDPTTGDLFHETTGEVLSDDEIYRREDEARVRHRNANKFGHPDFRNVSGMFPYPNDAIRDMNKELEIDTNDEFLNEK